MFKVLVNYNFTPDKDLVGNDYLIYDRSDNPQWLKDFDQSKIIYTRNIGQVDYDKLSYLVDHYWTLPDVFVWGKTNLFKYMSPEEYEKVATNKEFTPLLTLHHPVYDDKVTGQPVCFYQDGMYHEINNSWYVSQFQSKYFKEYGEFAHAFGLPNPAYLPFAPGGNYILTKDTVHKYARDFYDSMRTYLPYCAEPAEAQMAERSYYNLWKK